MSNYGRTKWTDLPSMYMCPYSQLTARATTQTRSSHQIRLLRYFSLVLNLPDTGFLTQI